MITLPLYSLSSTSLPSISRILNRSTGGTSLYSSGTSGFLTTPVDNLARCGFCAQLMAGAKTSEAATPRKTIDRGMGNLLPTEVLSVAQASIIRPTAVCVKDGCGTGFQPVNLGNLHADPTELSRDYVGRRHAGRHQGHLRPGIR